MPPRTIHTNARQERGSPLLPCGEERMGADGVGAIVSGDTKEVTCDGCKTAAK